PELGRTELIHKVSEHVGSKVQLCGWISHIRCRSEYVSNASFEELLHRLDETNHIEATVSIKGSVVKRPAGMVNPEMSTGQYEVLPDEEFRLKYRYIDLRRDQLQRNIRLRAAVNHCLRNFLNHKGILIRTPEGAREFLVPADRIAFDTSFALPQSPQQFKQMLMAAGFDRYFQIARCFRDEDLRADRQPEFTQLDMEMSFAVMEDVMQTTEETVKKLWKQVLGNELAQSFPRMTYKEALSRFGSDKPDTRYPFLIENLGEKGHFVTEKLTIPPIEFGPRIWDSISAMIEGKAGIAIDGRMVEELVQPDSTVEITVTRDTTDHVGSTLLGKVRSFIIRKLEETNQSTRYQKQKLAFLWVYDFPLLARAANDPDSGLPPRVFESMHHPFTAPVPEDLHLLASSPLQVRGQHYDLVLNGSEIGGGSIRIHSAELQEYILRDIIQLPESHISNFSHLLAALRSGCPPHGGIALGLDRLVAVMCGADSIRDVIAFPKNSGGLDVCVGAPNYMDPFVAEFQRAVQKYAGNTALVSGDDALTYRQLDEKIKKFSARLEDIPRGSVVGMAMPNGTEFVIVFMSLISTGLVAAPLNPIYTTDELKFYLEDCDASVVISDLDSVTEAATNLQVPVISPFGENSVTTSAKPKRGLDGVGLVLHTSGTTSTPKLVPIRTAAMLHSVQSLIKAYQLTDKDRILIVMPLFHVHGLIGCLLSTMFSGGAVTIPERFSAHHFKKDLWSFGATWISAVPTIYRILLSDPSYLDAEYINSRIRFIRACSSPLPADLYEHMTQLLTVPIFQAYAMTEAAHLVSTGCFANPGPAGSVGLPVGCTVAVYDEDFNPCNARVTGEICVSGPGIMTGYLKPKAANKTAFVDRHFRTGDLGYFDDNGNLFVSGRIKELINRGGEKINPNEVDAVLQKSSIVKEAVTFALPDNIYGETVACVAVLASTADRDAAQTILTLHCKTHLAPFKCPSVYFFVSQIPKSSIGKVQRSNLTRLYGNE
ncbi:Aspartate--tRNA ligase, partial [Paramicrosporidium saccamoebae]